MADDILIYNRRTGRIDVEQVYGSRWMELFYGRPWGRAITNRLLCRHPLSRLYGAIQGSGLSRGNISPFIAQYGIDLKEAVVPPQGFASFNDFFIRRLTAAARPVDRDPQALIAPADSRLQVFAIENHTRLTIKGAAMTLPQLLGRSAVSGAFEGGQCLVFRLAPSDYHRFGYVEDGRQGPVHTIDGPLHSVSPLSLRHKPDVHATNHRHWCLVHGPRLGTLIQVEVGAMMVGSIVQHQPAGGPCRRGQEKGYFQFGGSTVIVILPPGRAVIDPDIAEHSSQGIETLVRYGERVGVVTPV
jgi:phosphatidylserine decarboxylase